MGRLFQGAPDAHCANEETLLPPRLTWLGNSFWIVVNLPSRPRRALTDALRAQCRTTACDTGVFTKLTCDATELTLPSDGKKIP